MFSKQSKLAISSLFSFAIAIAITVSVDLYTGSKKKVEEKPSNYDVLLKQNAEETDAFVMTPQETIKQESLVFDPGLISVMIKYELNVEIMSAIIRSLGPIDDTDFFKLHSTYKDYDYQIQNFLKLSGMIDSKGRRTGITYTEAYVKLYGGNNLRKLYNSYKELYGKNLK